MSVANLGTEDPGVVGSIYYDSYAVDVTVDAPTRIDYIENAGGRSNYTTDLVAKIWDASTGAELRSVSASSVYVSTTSDTRMALNYWLTPGSTYRVGLHQSRGGNAFITTQSVEAAHYAGALHIVASYRGTAPDPTFPFPTQVSTEPRLNIGYTVNHAPTAPIPTSPASAAAVNRVYPIRLAATFADPDAGDSPSASHWRYRIAGAPSWTMVDQDNPLQTYDIPAGLPVGDYEWQAAYQDASGAPANLADLVWSASSFFTAADPPDGAVLAAPIAGETISTSSYTGTISAPSLSASRWTLYADDGTGNISSTILQGPVTVDTGDLRSHTFDGLANGVPVWWSVEIQNGGLWAPATQLRTPVSYTPPPTPTLVVANASSQGAITVAITNPAPGSGQPQTSYNDVFVRCADINPTADPYLPYSTTGTRIATQKPANSTLIDPWPASGVVYEYRAIAHGANGTTAASEWTAIDPIAEPTIYYGGGY